MAVKLRELFLNYTTVSFFCVAFIEALMMWDFYAYLNQWWITAGMRLGRFDFVPKAYDYVHEQWYNPKTCAGILQEPINMRYENCIFTSAHIGTKVFHFYSDSPNHKFNNCMTSPYPWRGIPSRKFCILNLIQVWCFLSIIGQWCWLSRTSRTALFICIRNMDFLNFWNHVCNKARFSRAQLILLVTDIIREDLLTSVAVNSPK